MAENRELITFKTGDVIGGRYEVLRYIGSGSMGLVYVCRHKDLDGMLVALKVLFPEVANDPVASQRFKNEIFASYDVFHKNVVRAYDYIQQDSLVAYTMEFVKGSDLAGIMDDEGAMNFEKFIDFSIQIADGVNAIHEAGIVHRDLKPENIMVREDGIIKIADFGIALLSDKVSLTDAGGVLGTILYVSPEYMTQNKVDSRSDIYAMGIIFYEMLTGRQPFESDNAYTIMDMRLKQDPPPPVTFREDIPDGINSIVLKCIQRDPQRRYQSSDDVSKDLQKVLKGERVPKFEPGTSARINLSEIKIDAEELPSVSLDLEESYINVNLNPNIKSSGNVIVSPESAAKIEENSKINERLRTGYVDRAEFEKKQSEDIKDVGSTYHMMLELILFMTFLLHIVMFIYPKT